jgi:SAM-dependent methyltransferase
MQDGTERSDQVRRELGDVIARTGPWSSHNIELAPGIFTKTDKISGEELKLRRITQLVRDLVGRPLDRVRALDLGALEGLYGIELALAGSEVVFVEGRDTSAEKIRFALRSRGIERGTVYTQDVRELSVATHGQFDVILCVGLLYHLELQSVLRLLTTMRELCTGVVIIDTHVALEDDELRGAAGTLWIDPDKTLSPIHTVQVDDESYRGRNYAEHDPGSPPEQRERAMWASLDNETSFWPTKPSLVNELMRAGFTSVLECLVPPLPGLAPDRVHLAAIVGQRRPLASSSICANVEYERWLESGSPETGVCPPGRSRGLRWNAKEVAAKMQQRATTRFLLAPARRLRESLREIRRLESQTQEAVSALGADSVARFGALEARVARLEQTAATQVELGSQLVALLEGLSEDRRAEPE